MTFEIQELESLHTITTHNKNVDHSNLWTVVEKYRRGNLFGYLYEYGDMDTKSWRWQLAFKCEDGQEHNEYAVAVMIGGRTAGHFPKNLNNIFNLFLALPNGAIKCNVTGNRINREARDRPEIPVQYFWTRKSCGLGRERCKKSYWQFGKKNNLRENKWELLAWKLVFNPVLYPLGRKVFRQNFIWCTKKVSVLWLSAL